MKNSSVFVKFDSKTIELTKRFSAAASRFGSDEYMMLQQVRKDYPTFKIAVKATRRKSNQFKGLTYDYMAEYISKKKNSAELMKDFETLTKSCDDASENGKASYVEVKKWFLEQFPEIKAQKNARRNEVERILSSVA